MNTSPNETARALLYRHGLPEDVIDGVLALHAQELVAIQREAHDTMRPYAHMGQPCKPEYACDARKVIDLIDPARTPAASAVPVPSVDRVALRQRIADALAEADGWVFAPGFKDGSPTYQGFLRQADAVLAELPAPVDRAAGELASLAVNAANALHDEKRHYEIACEENARLRAEVERLRAERAAVLLEAIRRVEDPEERAKTSVGSGLGWEAARGVLRRMAAEAQHATPDTEAHQPEHRWAAELYDPDAEEWVPGSRYLVRDRAVAALEHGRRVGPAWKDGTPTQRRLVRETKTYTVESESAGSAATTEPEA